MMFKLIGIIATVLFSLHTADDSIEWCPDQNLCTCYYDGEELHLLCTEIEDLLDIKQCLSENFSNVTIHSLDLFKCNATSVPPRFITNISIVKLEIKCPLSYFSKDAFLGSQSMFSDFRLLDHYLTTIPDALAYTPNLQELHLTLGILESVGEQISGLSYLQTLSLAENRIEYISPSAFNNLTLLSHVDLSRNMIKYIDPKMFASCKSIDMLSLAYNYLESAKGFLDFINPEIKDINEVKCGKGSVETEIDDTSIINLSDSEICPSKIALYLLISIGILGSLLLIASTIITYFRYGLNIKIWLYSHGFTWVKEDEIDKDKEFDAFVSYSSLDYKFVYQILIPTLENGSPPFFLCVHERNFPVGNNIQGSIMSAVKCSKRTILVLSSNFLGSEWCTLEFRAAHLQALKDKINRIIVIMYGEFPPEEDIDQELKVYLKSTTYLIWGEKYFWQKLHYALPKVTKDRERVHLHYNNKVDLLIGF